MKLNTRFQDVSLSAIQPEGWLRTFLIKQRQGLTGHLEAAGYPFNTDHWHSAGIKHRTGGTWWPYEQTAYWVDGMIRTGHLLRDPFLIKKANQSIDYVIKHIHKDGYMGPAHLKPAKDQNRWAHMVFFRALMARYSATGEQKIVDVLRKHYLSGTSQHWEDREVLNVEAILWTYEHTGDKELLDHATWAFNEFQQIKVKEDISVPMLLKDDVVGWCHGVTYNETVKLPALMYKYNGDRRLLRATLNGYRKVERDQMLVDGVHSSTERLRGKDPLDSHETCDISDMTWSLGYLLQITGDAHWADAIERAVFNAGPGAVKNDFKALQYFSCPNQVVAEKTSNHNLFFCGDPAWMCYRPNPATECCPGNVHRFMPNFASRLWMVDQSKPRQTTLVAAMYGPSRITACPGNGRTEVTVVEETRYPFGETIDFIIQADRAVKFPLVLRVPEWCDAPSLAINGKEQKRALKPGSYFTLNRTFEPNDRVTLKLPMKLKMTRWPRGGIAIERGPLVYSLKIEEDWRVDKADKRSTKDFPAWDLYPASPWNYALCVNEKTLERDVEVIHRAGDSDPFTLEGAPIELRVPARKVNGWRLAKKRTVEREIQDASGIYIKKIKGSFLQTPDLPDPKTLPQKLAKKIETVTLVPYGCTHLRVTIFPQAPAVRK